MKMIGSASAVKIGRYNDMELQSDAVEYEITVR